MTRSMSERRSPGPAGRTAATPCQGDAPGGDQLRWNQLRARRRFYRRTRSLPAPAKNCNTRVTQTTTPGQQRSNRSAPRIEAVVRSGQGRWDGGQTASPAVVTAAAPYPPKRAHNQLHNVLLRQRPHAMFGSSLRDWSRHLPNTARCAISHVQPQKSIEFSYFSLQQSEKIDFHSRRLVVGPVGAKWTDAPEKIRL
jgi:hypothetical protein